MKKYFELQYKRLLRFLPGALFVALVLIISLFLAFQLFTQQNASQEENQKFPFAVCGDTEHAFLQMGLSTLTSFDSSRFAIDILEMEEAEAAKALSRGEIAAYVVVPDGFMDLALSGQIPQLKFYSTTGATGIVSLVKEELSKVISTLLLSSQDGVYAIWDVLVDNDLRNKTPGQMDQLAFTYVDYIFVRDRVYSLEELGIGDSLGLEGYILCGLLVLFLMLICLPFAARMIPGDPALGRMLCSKGKSAWKQSICDFAAYAAALLGMLLVIVLIAKLSLPEIENLILLLGKLLPVLLLTAAFSFMLYSLSRDMIGGVMLMFFVSVILCFVSGCLYPVYFFPVQVQQIAQWLPMGIARAQLASYLTGSTPAWTLPMLLLYSVAFTGIGTWARVRHIQEVTQ